MEHVWIITSKVFSKMSQICSASMYVSGYVSHVKSLPYSPINRCNVVQRNIAPCPTTRRTYSARQSTTFGRAFWYQPLKRKMECNTVWPYAECIQHEYKTLVRPWCQRFRHASRIRSAEHTASPNYIRQSILQARHQLLKDVKPCAERLRHASRIRFGGAYCGPDINH